MNIQFEKFQMTSELKIRDRLKPLFLRISLYIAIDKYLNGSLQDIESLKLQIIHLYLVNDL